MAKVAKLVTVIVTTRVIVEDTATRDEIMAVAREPLANAVRLNECDREILNDDECPYGTFDTDN